MTIRNYIIAKNTMIYKHISITLVPENQIVDTLKPKLLSIQDDIEACPYCVVYWGEIDYSEDDKRCQGCPMFEVGNGCIHHKGNTYSKIGQNLTGFYQPWFEELTALIKQFNKELP